MRPRWPHSSLRARAAFCAPPSSPQAFFNNDNTKIVTAGNYNLRVWTYDRCMLACCCTGRARTCCTLHRHRGPGVRVRADTRAPPPPPPRSPPAPPPHRRPRSANNKLVPQEAQLGSLQRKVTALSVDADDAFVYAGTTSGDVLQVPAGWERGAGVGRGCAA